MDPLRFLNSRDEFEVPVMQFLTLRYAEHQLEHDKRLANLIADEVIRRINGK